MSNSKQVSKEDSMEDSMKSGSKKYLSQAIYENLHQGDNDVIKNLTGKLLTLADAIFTDPEQRKAVKDNIQQIIYAHRQTMDNYRKAVCGRVYIALEKANAKESEAEGRPYYVPRDWGDHPMSVDYIQLDDSVDLTR